MDLEKRLTLALENNRLSAECQTIASEIKKGNVKLFNFIEGLQPLLTNTNVELRKQSIQALSSLLDSLPVDFLLEAEINFIVGFYCDRLKDHYSVLPSTLKGISFIVKMKNLPENGPARVLSAMFENVQCQTLLLPDRQIVYSIFETLLREKSSNLKPLGVDLVYGVINSIDGESDPRNLLIIFRIIPFFVKQFPLGHLIEEMFEVIACYFPVQYNAPKSESSGITRESLAEALTPCLCATPEFAEFCLPLLIEKMDSNLKVAKLDSLQVLIEGAGIFGAKRLQPHLREIWQILQKEILQNVDLEVKQLALTCTTALIKALTEEDKSISSDFVEEIIINAKWALCNASLSNSVKDTEKLLEAVAKASREMCEKVLCAIVPACLMQYSTKTELQDKVFLLETFNRFISIANEYGLSIKHVSNLEWSDVPAFYIEELNNQSPQIRIKLMNGLIAQKTSLNETQRKALNEKLFLEIETGNEDTLLAAHSCLYSFTELYPIEVVNIIANRFSLNDNNVSNETISRRIEALSLLSRIPKIGCEILPKIVDVVCTSDDSDNIPIKIVALSCLEKLLTTQEENFDIHSFLYKEDVLNKFVKISTSETDERVSLISNICRLITRKLNLQEQKEVIQNYSRILEGDVSECDIALIDGIMIALRPDIELKNNELIKNLYKIAVESLNTTARLASCHLIAVLINKIKLTHEYEQIIQFLKDNINNSLNSPEETIEAKKAVSTLLNWLTASLVKRGNANSQDFLNYQMSTLQNTEIGNYVAGEFKTLVDRNDDILTEENFCLVKMLYKQRILENIIQGCNESTRETKCNYLKALLYTCQEISMELLSLYLGKLVPCFMDSFTQEELIIPTLNLLQPLLETRNSVFTTEAKHFISKFLDLCSHENMKIRTITLNCLLIYVEYPPIIIHPFKLDVLEKLHTLTDDKKRLVRKLAVKARLKWFMINPSDVKS